MYVRFPYVNSPASLFWRAGVKPERIWPEIISRHVFDRHGIHVNRHILDPSTILIVFNVFRVILTRRRNDCFRYHAWYHFETSAYIQKQLVLTNAIYAHVIAAPNFLLTFVRGNDHRTRKQ